VRFHDDWKITFRVIASFAFALAAAMAFLLSMRNVVLANRGIDLYRLWPALVWLLVSAVGTWRCTRWGVALLAVPLASIFLWSFGAALLDREYVSAIFAAIMSPVVLAPAILLERKWRLLTPWW
jgi:hypothetical protein